MLTLKVIETDSNGDQSIHLFSGDSISHKEYPMQDHHIEDIARKNSPEVRIVGHMISTSSTQEFTISDVKIYLDDHSYKNELLILPKADCYIMDNGKTVDTFYCGFKPSKEVTGGEKD